MAPNPKLMLERQVQKVRRQMFMQAAVNGLIVGWLAACGVVAIWFLAKPFALGENASPWMDWAIGGAAAALSTIAALIWAYRKTPAPVQAALSLDERFQLRERVTTSLTLSDDQQSSPAGQALLSDAEKKIESLDVGSRFPVRFGWKSALVPAAVVAVALLVIFYQPVINKAEGGSTSAAPLTPEQVKEIEQKKQEFLAKPKSEKKQTNRPNNPNIEKIEAQVQEILKRPMTTKDEMKDRLAEMSSLEEQKRKEAPRTLKRSKPSKINSKNSIGFRRKTSPNPATKKAPVRISATRWKRATPRKPSKRLTA